MLSSFPSSSAEILPAEPFLLTGGNSGTKTVANKTLPVPSSCGQTERWEAALVRRRHILIVQVYHIVLSDIVATQNEREKKNIIKSVE